MTDNRRKVVIVGAGKVGASLAYTVVLRNLASELVLVDTDRDRARGEALDISHGIAYLRQVTVRDGDFTDCTDADIVVIAAGIPRRPGQSRLDLAQNNIAVAQDIVRHIMQHATNPLIIVISNPVDILTYVIQRESGLPASRVIGSGTTLDTGRFRYLLSRHCNVDVRNVHADIIGEHGDGSVPVWSRVTIASKPFQEYCADCKKRCLNINREQIFEQTRASGAEIIRMKGATFYGVALAAARIIEAVMDDEHTVMTVSSVMSGSYGIMDVALSLPCVINAKGIDRYLNVHLSEDELRRLQESAGHLKAALDAVYSPAGEG